MPWALLLEAAPALISAGSTLIGNSQQQQGTQAAVNNANQGFNYLSGSPLATNYLPNGAAANNAAASLLGVGGGAAPAGAAPAAAAPGGLTPGMAAAKAATGTRGGGGSGGIKPLSIDPLNLFGGRKNNSPIQDISQAVALGRPITDAQWAQAGYGPGGAAPGGAAAAATPAPAAAPGLAPADAFNNYLNSTGTKFQLDEGTAALNSGHAAGGILNSGSTSKALIKYGQSLGATSFDNYLKQLGGLSSAGLAAGQSIGSAGASGGATAAGISAAGGNTAASNTGALGGALNTGLGAISNYLSPKAATYNSGTASYTPGPGGF